MTSQVKAYLEQIRKYDDKKYAGIYFARVHDALNIAVTNETAKQMRERLSVILNRTVKDTELIRDYFPVSKAAKRHRDEFQSDGLKVLRGEDLELVMDKLSITNKTRNLTIWNPRATLRLGYLLRDSEIAKAVRTTRYPQLRRTSTSTKSSST